MSRTISNGTICDGKAAQHNAGLEPGAVKPHTEKLDMIDWDGVDDPANPRNWKGSIKMAHVCLVSAFTLYA